MLIVNSLFANSWDYFMDLTERIREMASKQGLNIKSIEVSAGFGNGTIRRWGSSPPSADKLLKIANMLNTSCEYLLTGEGEYTTLSSEDIEWLTLIHHLPRDAQLEFKGEMRRYLKSLKRQSVAADESIKRTGTDNLGK